MRSSSKRSAGLAACLLACTAGWLALACAGELAGNEEQYFATTRAPGSGGASATGCDRAAAIIDKNCKACHNAEALLGGLDLVSPGVETRLVDQPSSDSECASLKRIDSANPADSFLLEKIESTDPACGDPMPFGSRLAATDIDCLKAWVNGLAAGGGS
jgi:hypothetical protein